MTVIEKINELNNDIQSSSRITDSGEDIEYYVHTLPEKITALRDFISDKCALSQKLMDTEMAINESLTKEINDLEKIDFKYDQDKRDGYEKAAKNKCGRLCKLFINRCKSLGVEILSQKEF